MIWCRCNAHLVESDDDQTPDVECCACRGKLLQAARRPGRGGRAAVGLRPVAVRGDRAGGAMTRLADLNPRWLRAVADPLSQGYGVEFDCPCGNHDAPGCPRRIWLMFANPIGGPPARIGKQKWQRAGDSFDALTLEPSIHHVDASGATHWHGWLRAGDLVPC